MSSETIKHITLHGLQKTTRHFANCIRLKIVCVAVEYYQLKGNNVIVSIYKLVNVNCDWLKSNDDIAVRAGSRAAALPATRGRRHTRPRANQGQCPTPGQRAS